MIDLSKAKGLSLAARQLPSHRRQAPVHPSTLIRWIQQGVPGPDGSRVRLEAVRLGGRWVTDDDALHRFCDRLTPAREAAVPNRSPAEGRRADQHADHELEKRGL